MNRNASKTNTSIFAFIVSIVVILVIGVLLSSALEAGAWTFIALVIGFVVIAALIAWFASFIVRQYVQVTDTRVKAREIDNNYKLAMAKAGFLPPGFERASPQIHAPVRMETHPEVEPYRNLAIELVAITREKLGDDTDRILSREQAESYELFRGHKTWEHAIDFLEAWGYAYQHLKGGRSEGTKIGKEMTIAELAKVITPPARL